MHYRSEIDGLRAVAVLSVILFHAEFEWFSGGFVGVDIFFVISGYLITTIITSELAEGQFSIMNFYERRARRILPALFFMMAFLIPFAYFFMLPDPLENFGQSLVSTALFANNILLAMTSGYWDLASHFKPLLHTWSLAVEEQYYVVFPIFMFLIWRRGKCFIFLGFLVTILASLYFAQIESDRNLAFYSLHTRVFELLIGALLCVYFVGRSENHNSFTKNVLSSIGFMMITFSVLFFDEDTHLPGLLTLVPVIGVSLVIYFTDSTTFLYKILSSHIMVSIGLVSYSAYLYHQPLLSFLSIYSKNKPLTVEILFIIVLTFVLAWISYRLVESPFRDKEKIGRTSFFSFIAISIFSLSLIGLYLNSSAGIPFRFDANYSPVERSQALSKRAWDYKNSSFKEIKKVNVLVIGNSWGRDTVNMLKETYSEDHIEIVYRDDLNICSLKNGVDVSLFSESDVILFASGYSHPNCNKRFITDSLYRNKTFFIGPKNFGYNLNWIMRIQGDKRKNLTNPVTYRFYKNEQNARDQIPEFNYISIYDALVEDNSILITTEDGRLISDDRSHLTLAGARYLGKLVLKNSKIDNLLN